jgi:hypothetical protein
MTRFELFDAVELREAVALTGGGTAAAGTPGAIVEVLHDGKAYMVELFNGWVKANIHGSLVTADPADPQAFTQTIGLEVVHPQQLRLRMPATETVGSRSRLLIALEELPETLVDEVMDFAEFLRQRQHRQVSTRERVS